MEGVQISYWDGRCSNLYCNIVGIEEPFRLNVVAMLTENSYLEFSGDFAFTKPLCLGSLLITKQLTEQHL